MLPFDNSIPLSPSHLLFESSAAPSISNSDTSHHIHTSRPINVQFTQYPPFKMKSNLTFHALFFMMLISVTLAAPWGINLVNPVKMPGPCTVIGYDDFIKDVPTPNSPKGRYIAQHTSKKGEKIMSSWDTEHGYIVLPHGQGQVLLQNRGSNAWSKNAIMLKLINKDEDTLYYWINKNGACTLGYDYARVNGGYAYGLERFGP